MASVLPTTSVTEPQTAIAQPVFLLLADLLHMATASLLLASVLLSDTGVSTPLWLMAAALVAWVMARGWAWAVLSVILVVIMAREPRYSAMSFGWDSALYAWLCLALVAYTAGFQTIRRQLRNWLGLALQLLMRGVPPGVEAENWNRQAALGLVRMSLGMGVRALRLLGLVMLSMLAFVQLPITPDGRGLWWQRSVQLQMFLWPGPFVFLLGVGGLMLLSLAAWRTMTARQAAIYVKSQSIRYYFRDCRLLMRRLAKLKRKK